MNGDPLSEQVAKYVMTCNNDMLRKLTVSSIARIFEVNRSHLAREFKSGINFTLCKFIQNEKMIRAAMLLMNTTELTVAEISKLLGFCSTEYFRGVFKQYFGIAPSKFREYRNHGTQHIYSMNTTENDNNSGDHA